MGQDQHTGEGGRHALCYSATVGGSGSFTRQLPTPGGGDQGKTTVGTHCSEARPGGRDREAIAPVAKKWSNHDGHRISDLDEQRWGGKHHCGKDRLGGSGFAPCLRRAPELHRIVLQSFPEGDGY